MSIKSNDSRIIDWRDHFGSRGLDVDFSGIVIPKYDDKLWRPVLMPAHRELPLNATLAMTQQNYIVTTYVRGNDLDREVIYNARSRTLGSYVILVRMGMEPDLEYQGKSTREADPLLLIGMNLRERLILGGKVFAETGKHLDVVGWTLCTGSRGAGGSVPGVDLYDCKVRVGWSHLDAPDAQGGLREAVS